MISLITGLPGNAKTLYAIGKVIKEIEEFKKKGIDRKVYYFNITFNEDHPKYELVKDWIRLTKKQVESIQLTPSQVEEGDNLLRHETIENGSLFLFDEAQDVYPTRPASKQIPNFVKFFEKHRHSGLDFYLITQGTRQLDIHVRELVNYHYELDRHGKAEFSNVRISPKKTLDVCPPDLIKTDIFKFPKDIYGLYKSADLHTQTHGFLDFIKGLPLKAKVIVSLTILLILYSAYSITQDGFGINSISKSSDSKSTGSSISPDLQNNAAQNIMPNMFKSKKTNTEFLIYFSHIIYLNDSYMPSFIMVGSDGSFTNVGLNELRKIGYEIKQIRDDLYTLNGSLIPNLPLNITPTSGKKDEKK